MQRKTFISGLLLLSLISALISPVCVYAAGKGQWTQICQADGSVGIIRLNEQGQPASGSQTPTQNHVKASLCSVCLVTALATQISGASVIAFYALPDYQQPTARLAQPLALAAIAGYQSRAPPLIL